MGAIASGGVRVVNAEVVAWYGLTEADLRDAARDELIELERQERRYREGRPPPAVRDRVVVLVDDGLATGSTMKAAVQAVRAQGPARVVVAVPVGAPQTCRDLAGLADEVVCPRMPRDFSAVGEWYEDFPDQRRRGPRAAQRLSAVSSTRMRWSSSDRGNWFRVAVAAKWSFRCRRSSGETSANSRPASLCSRSA